MPYYQAGDYYQGDYYQAGGIFGSIGKLVKKGVGAALSLTPAGRIAQTVAKAALVLRRPRPMGFAPGEMFGEGLPFSGEEGAIPAFRGRGPMGKRRRLDPLNVKALRRAGRRLKGFLRIARRMGALPVAGGKGKRIFKARRKAS